jgi:hypothetical protein
MAAVEASGESETPLGTKGHDLSWDDQELYQQSTSAHSPQPQSTAGSLSYTFIPGEVSSSSRSTLHPSSSSSKGFAFRPNATAALSPEVQYEGTSPTATSWLSDFQVQWPRTNFFADQ